MVFLRAAAIALVALLVSACASRPATHAAAPAGVLQPAGGHYRLDVPSGWTRVPEQEREYQADLFIARETGTWLVARSTSGSTLRLADLVAFRRNALFEGNEIRDFRERRSYLRRGLHVPASIARYRVGSEVLLVMIAVDRGLAVELFANMPVDSRREHELTAILDSLRFVEPEAR
jgi:hypothetical protein